jgi:hypothetical protein
MKMAELGKMGNKNYRGPFPRKNLSPSVRHTKKRHAVKRYTKIRPVPIP